MKIKYKSIDFFYMAATDKPSREPDNPIFLRDLNENQINFLVESIYSDRSAEIMNLLLPEQIYVLRCHASHLYSFYYACGDITKFHVQMSREIYQLAKQEIEPGMFKDEDIL
jgi:hypothetical protein